MKRNKWYVMIALAAVLFAAGSALSATKNNTAKKATRGGGGPGMGMHAGGGMGMGMGMGGGMGLCMAIQNLLENPEFKTFTGISDTQADKISTLLSDNAKKVIRNKAEIQILQMDLQDLMDADSPNKTQIYAKIDQISKMQSDDLKAMADAQIQIKTILTADQLDKAKEYIQQNRPSGKNKNKQGRGKGLGGGLGMGPGGMGGIDSPDDAPEE